MIHDKHNLGVSSFSLESRCICTQNLKWDHWEMHGNNDTKLNCLSFNSRSSYSFHRDTVVSCGIKHKQTSRILTFTCLYHSHRCFQCSTSIIFEKENLKIFIPFEKPVPCIQHLRSQTEQPRFQVDLLPHTINQMTQMLPKRNYYLQIKNTRKFPVSNSWVINQPHFLNKNPAFVVEKNTPKNHQNKHIPIPSL